MTKPKTKGVSIDHILHNNVYTDESGLIQQLGRALHKMSASDVYGLALIIDIKTREAAEAATEAATKIVSRKPKKDPSIKVVIEDTDKYTGNRHLISAALKTVAITLLEIMDANYINRANVHGNDLANALNHAADKITGKK